jgi:hypothetical protein
LQRFALSTPLTHRRKGERRAAIGWKGVAVKHYDYENRIDTTLGDLIEAVSEVVFEYCKNNQEAYTVTSLVLAEILRSRVADKRWAALSH